MIEHTILLLLLLFCAGLCAGYVDTLAGGGGLITVPALLLTGMPIVTALATNKLQSSFGTLTASSMMLAHKKVRWRTVSLPVCAAFIGSACGTVVLHFIDASSLEVATPIALLCMTVYFLFSPQRTQRRARLLKAKIYSVCVVPLIGSYDGMFGPGTGSLFAASGVGLRGYTLLQATVRAKLFNCATNVASLLVFLVAGNIAWGFGVAMLCGQLIGAYFGSRSLFRINPRLLRWLIVCVCVAMLVKYLSGR